MDLNIAGKSAIVCASSKGLGKACAAALDGGEVRPVVADVTTDEGRDALFTACAAPDIVVNNAGGPPPSDFRQWGQQDWFDAVNANMFRCIDTVFIIKQILRV
jgi:3-oxoacyl-[acyl-carrier protein] reductase